MEYQYPDESRGYQITAATSSTIAALIIAASLRFYVRGWKTHNWGMDDSTMLFGLLVNIVGAAFNLEAVHNGIGQHSERLTYTKQVEARKYLQLATLFNIVAIWIVKVSICFFLLRIIETTRRNLARFLYFLIGINTVVNLVLFITWFVQSTPVYSLWDVKKTRSHLPSDAIIGIAYFSAAFNMTTDIICALLPVFFLYKLQISARRKAALLVLTTLGLFTSIAALLKLIFLNQIVASHDTTWAPVDVTICAQVEQNMGAFLANLPPLKPMFTKVYKRASMLSSRSKKSEPGWKNTLDSFQTARARSSETGSALTSPITPVTPIASRGKIDPYYEEQQLYTLKTIDTKSGLAYYEDHDDDYDIER